MICDADYPVDGVSVIDELKSAVRQSVPPAEWGNNDDNENNDSDDSLTLPSFKPSKAYEHVNFSSDDSLTLPPLEKTKSSNKEHIIPAYSSDDESSSTVLVIQTH